MKTTLDLGSLPDSPGVYLMYGPSAELLYVGKSRTIRTRVRSHLAAREEAWMMRRVRKVEARETAGELGALLLESQLIKELKPMFNVASRRKRRIIIARRVENAGGYAGIVLEAVDRIDMSDSSPIMAIFKHHTQAKEYLAGIARTYRLCPKLLRLENSRKYCFSYHLGYCDGACMGEEDAARYNARVEEAFAARRFKAWPYDGGVVVEERFGEKHEKFLVDNWCLLASVRSFNGTYQQDVFAKHRFDYDSYKILYSFLTDAMNSHMVRPMDRVSFDSMYKELSPEPRRTDS